MALTQLCSAVTLVPVLLIWVWFLCFLKNHFKNSHICVSLNNILVSSVLKIYINGVILCVTHMMTICHQHTSCLWLMLSFNIRFMRYTYLLLAAVVHLFLLLLITFQSVSVPQSICYSLSMDYGFFLVFFFFNFVFPVMKSAHPWIGF